MCIRDSVYTGVERTTKRAVPLRVIKPLRTLDLSLHPAKRFARAMLLFSFYTRGMSMVDMAFLRKKDLANGIPVSYTHLCHKIIKMGYAIGFPLVGVALFCDYWIIGFYTNNETLVQHTVPPFIVMLFNYIFAVPGYCLLYTSPTAYPFFSRKCMLVPKTLRAQVQTSDRIFP